MPDRVGEAIGGEAALFQAQRVTAAAQAEILFRDLEPVLGAAQGLKPQPRGLAQNTFLAVVPAAVQQDAGAGLGTASDPPPELVKLGQAEAVGVFDDHDGGVGHIDPDLDHGGGDQQGNAAVGEIGHDGLALGTRHLAVGEADLDLEGAAQIDGAGLGGGEVDTLALGDQGTDPVGLGTAVDRRLEAFGHLADASQRQDGGGDGRAPRRFFGQARHLELAVLGQLQRARDGGRGHGQQMDTAGAGIALGLKALTLVDAETMLFVDHGEGQPVETDGVLEQGVGADGDLGLARGEGGETDAALGGGVAAGQQDGRDPGGLQHRGQPLPVLTGEDFGRGHEGGLEARCSRVGHGQGGDGGLARADVALQ